MEKFFYPESVAVFGVSDTPSNLARIIVENLVRFGFRGDVYPMGTSGGAVAGLEVRRELEEVPGVPDLAVLLVPARYVPGTLEACGKKGIRCVILESGGFGELSGDRASLEKEIISIAERYGIRLIGPNCFGVVNAEAGVVLPFFIINPSYVKQGSASLISQSGGVFYDTCMLCSIENIGMRKLISIGNKLMTDENDVLEYVLKDEGTSVAGLYLENFSDGRRFMGLAASTDRPIVVLKANRSEASSEIAKFHTTALAGDDDVADAAMRQAGVIRVTDFQEMVDCFKIFSLPVLAGRRLALISRSGGHGVICADAAQRHGFEFAKFSEGFMRTVLEKKLNVIAATNPLDIGDIYDLEEYAPILDATIEEEGVDGIVFVVTYSSESDGAKIRDFIRHAARVTPGCGKPVALCVVTNRDEWFAIKEAADFPVFTGVDQAVKALSWSYEHHLAGSKRRSLSGRAWSAPPAAADGGVAGRRFVGPEEGFSLLARYGLPVAGHFIAKDREGALAAARRLGYPVALKTGDGSVLHKSEAGGVIVGIGGPEELAGAIEAMGGQRYLVQKMAPAGREIIIGGRLDKEFGPVVICGLGGIYAEVMADRSIRVAPVDEYIAAEMIGELKGFAILKGARGKAPADVDALKGIIVKVSRLLMENPGIVNLDINPVIVHEEGKGCTIVDVKIETTETTGN